jgi:hypothetical protein
VHSLRQRSLSRPAWPAVAVQNMCSRQGKRYGMEGMHQPNEGAHTHTNEYRRYPCSNHFANASSYTRSYSLANRGTNAQADAIALPGQQQERRRDGYRLRRYLSGVPKQQQMSRFRRLPKHLVPRCIIHLRYTSTYTSTHSVTNICAHERAYPFSH